MKNVRIGTRGSALALWQANHVRGLIESLGNTTELVIIKTQGDRIDDIPFSKMSGKGFFTKELEDAQLDGRVDLAVHSMKDMTTEAVGGLVIGAMIGREDPRDLLLARPDALEDGRGLPLRHGTRVGTSSARRQAQALHLNPGITLADLRGNVPTRVQKLRDGHYDAILIAAAGIARLGLDLEGLAARPLDPERFVPAPAHGRLALQCRDEPWLRELLGQMHMADAARPVLAERWLLERLDGGCQLPFGCHVRPVASGFALDLFLQGRESEGSPKPPLALHLEGPDPMALAHAAWESVRAYRG